MGTNDDEAGPVERRAVPRAPIRDLSVRGVDPPLVGVALEVTEVGLDSFFLLGDATRLCVVGRPYRLCLRYGERVVHCVAECVRQESEPRHGVALRLLAEEGVARSLLADVLQPTSVPRDAD